jgi:hypothetical protein
MLIFGFRSRRKQAQFCRALYVEKVAIDLLKLHNGYSRSAAVCMLVVKTLYFPVGAQFIPHHLPQYSVTFAVDNPYT